MSTVFVFGYFKLRHCITLVTPPLCLSLTLCLSLPPFLPSPSLLTVLQGANKPSVTASSVFRCDYNVYSTFQSHEPEFDYLKSLEIEEKINQICWVKQTGSSLFLLTTNGKGGVLLII